MGKIYLIKNVLADDERKKLIADSRPLLKQGKQLSEYFKTVNPFPGKQTFSDLYLNSKFTFSFNHMVDMIWRETGLNLEIKGAWVNWTNGKKKDIAWHSHNRHDYALVYYMKTFPFFSNGTLFREPIGFVKAPQNSLILFPGRLEHTAPSSLFRFSRYTVAINLNIRT
tara:strand:+ start:250 stop:753 length:504 start_codon:yes stop_codon:yes gene_type:complete